MDNRKLQNLTKNESKEILIPGTIISYRDINNPQGEAAIVSRQKCKWQEETITVRWSNTSQEEEFSAFCFQSGWELVRIATPTACR